ncbi:MAG: SIS domain-containing protein [Eubacteriales bacterium]|nr:SIS domain-containing protein [Eubacteriales bacterium]
MYLTEQEIMSQQEALEKTYDYLTGMRGKLQEFLKSRKKFVFLGCGSSYMLAKSGQRIFIKSADVGADAVAGGDYLLNPVLYQNLFTDSIVVAISRSGKTSEILRSLMRLKAETNCRILSLTMLEDNDFTPYTDMDLTLDWCYDKSVCQTRSVTNFYLALCMLGCFYEEREWELELLRKAVQSVSSFQAEIRPAVKALSEQSWDKAVVLADGAFAGIGEEGALAFTEIAQIPGICCRLLDYRHGPMVLNDRDTVNIVLLHKENETLQMNLLIDLKSRGGKIVTLSSNKENKYDADAHFCIGPLTDSLPAGILFINVLQLLAFEKAMVRGVNPDLPTGLDAYITLDE